MEYSLSNIFNPVTKLKPPYLLTYSTQQCPSSEPNWFSASHEIPRILKNARIHYCIHTCLPPDPILSQLHPAHDHTSYFLKFHLDIILSSMPGYFKWSLALQFPHQNPVYASPRPHSCYMHRPSHFSRFYHPKNNG